MSNLNEPGFSAEQAPESVQKILDALVSQAVARCHRSGIPLEDFYRVLREEQELQHGVGVSELFERAFRRLERIAN